LKFIQPPVYSWFASFNNFISQGQTWTDACGATGVDKLPYLQQLRRFFDVTIESTCCQNYGICGEQYITDVRFDDEGDLVSSRLRVMTKPLRGSEDYIRAAREARLVMDYVLGDFLEDNPDLSAYPYSLFYVFYDQYSYIRSVAI
jgi:Niemann-Pick C1 protein